MKTAYDRSKEYSDCKIDALRQSLQSCAGADLTILTCGSYARREASRHSDIDYFVISDSEVADGDSISLESIAMKIKDIVPNSPADNGAFAHRVNKTEFLRHIGGEDDSNSNITRRMLFLLEGEWLSNECGFRQFGRSILERYVTENMADHQLTLFLLNDIIRYYRTIAVDYEHKISDQGGAKAWAIRNIKLVFSRKLLYASGIFCVAGTADRSRAEKIGVLEQWFNLPVIERIEAICGRNESERVVRSYSKFLEALECGRIRDHLEKLPSDKRSDPEFRAIKNEGHRFTTELMKLLDDTFHTTHPIRRAILF